MARAFLVSTGQASAKRQLALENRGMFTSQQIREFVSGPMFDARVLCSSDPSYPRISVVMPSYNQARFLERTILSALNQNYPNTELIIIDGGSKDGSVELIEKYAPYVSYSPRLIIKPSRRWALPDLGELWEYRELIYFFAWRDIKVRYKQTVLGGAWAVIQPFFTMVSIVSPFASTKIGVASPVPMFSTLPEARLVSAASTVASITSLTTCPLLSAETAYLLRRRTMTSMCER